MNILLYYFVKVFVTDIASTQIHMLLSFYDHITLPMFLLLLWPLDVHLLKLNIPLVKVFMTDIASIQIHILVSFVII